MNTPTKKRHENKSHTARKNILAKLKQQVEGSDYSKLPEEPEYIYPQLTRDAQIEQFVQHLSHNHASVIKTSQQQITENIEQILQSLGIDSLMYGKDFLYSAEVEKTAGNIKLSTFDFVLEDKKQLLFNQTPASITSSYAAIAATGSIVLWPSKNEPRTLSLVPPVHIVVVDANQLYCDFSTLIKTQQWQDKLPTNVLLISGPSKTADIQQTLAYGAHGPEKLFVLLLNS